MIRLATLWLTMCVATVAASAAERMPLRSGNLSIAFEVGYLAFLEVSGRLAEASGELTLDEEEPRRSTLQIVARTASISTGSSLRDAALRSERFFDATMHPELHFVSTRIEFRSHHGGMVVGNLTIRGVTRPLALAFVLHSADNAEPTNGRERPVILRATGLLRRSDWGMTSMLPAVADDVKLAIEVRIGHDNRPAPKEARAQ